MNETTPLAGDFGTVVRGAPGESPEIDRDALSTLLKRSGVVLFRGFDASLEQFERLTHALGNDFIVYHGSGRTVADGDGTTQTAAPGRDSFPAHIEKGYSPPTPALIFFYCVTPAVRGGETTVYDGTRLFEALSERTRDFFVRTRMRWKLRVAPEFWQRTCRTADRDAAQMVIQYYFAALNQSGKGESASFSFDGDDLLIDFLKPCTAASPRGKGVAFANAGLAYLHLLRYEAGVDLRMEDGSAFPMDVLEEADERANDVVVPIVWNKGDIVAIDNETVLHGRPAFDDPNRRILARMCANYA